MKNIKKLPFTFISVFNIALMILYLICANAVRNSCGKIMLIPSMLLAIWFPKYLYDKNLTKEETIEKTFFAMFICGLGTFCYFAISSTTIDLMKFSFLSIAGVEAFAGMMLFLLKQEKSI